MDDSLALVVLALSGGAHCAAYCARQFELRELRGGRHRVMMKIFKKINIIKYQFLLNFIFIPLFPALENLKS